MKKYILILLGIWLFAACSDDKGNYDYHDINEVMVAGTADESLEVLEAGKWYTKVAFVDHLLFDPLIRSTMEKNDASAYEYEWKMIPNGDDFKDIENPDFTISTNRKIDMPLTMDSGEYACFFIVKDKETGVSWITPFYLRIKSMTEEGWMVLCEENNESRMDMITNTSPTEDLVAHDIWKEEEFRPGKPIRLLHNCKGAEGSVSMLVTDKDTYIMDKADLHVGEDNSFRWQFGVVPESIRLDASAMSMYAGKDRWVIVDEQGGVYSMDRSVHGSVFEYEINKLDGKTPFKAAPFVGTDLSKNWKEMGHAAAVLYDDTHKQFLVMRNNSEYPSLMTFSGSQLFPAQTGRDIVWMESATCGTVYALLKDPSTNEFYFYGMKLRGEYEEPDNWWEEGDYTEYNEQVWYGKVNGPGIENATLFAFQHEQTLPYLFYSDGHTIWQFDIGHPDIPAKEVLSFPSEEIKVIKFNPFVAWVAYADWERARNYQLVVGSNVQGADESSCGIMRMYEVPNLMGELVQMKEFRELGKIVDIAYKERD